MVPNNANQPLQNAITKSLTTQRDDQLRNRSVNLFLRWLSRDLQKELKREVVLRPLEQVTIPPEKTFTDLSHIKLSIYLIKLSHNQIRLNPLPKQD
jgi:hypothetical protein